MKYKQLTPDQRYQIFYERKHSGWNQTAIADELNVHKSTISRELKRNVSLRGYRPHKAQELAQGRRHGKAKPRISDARWDAIEAALRQ